MHALLTQDGQLFVAAVIPKPDTIERIAGTFPTTSFRDVILSHWKTQPPELRSSVFSLSVAVRRLFIMCTLDCSFASFIVHRCAHLFRWMKIGGGFPSKIFVWSILIWGRTYFDQYFLKRLKPPTRLVEFKYTVYLFLVHIERQLIPFKV